MFFWGCYILNAHDWLKLLMMKQILLLGDDEVQAVELVPEEVDGLLLAENLRHRRPENVFSIVVETVLLLVLLIMDDIPSRQLLHYGPNLPLASNLVGREIQLSYRFTPALLFETPNYKKGLIFEEIYIFLKPIY